MPGFISGILGSFLDQRSWIRDPGEDLMILQQFAHTNGAEN
jgi:hypothetical protein